MCFLKRINVGYSQKSDKKSEEAIEQTGLIATDNKNVSFIQKKKKENHLLNNSHNFGQDTFLGVTAKYFEFQHAIKTIEKERRN